MSVEIFYHFINVILCPILGRFVEGCIEAIRAWCCVAPHIPNDVMDFIEVRSRISIPEYVIVVNCLLFFYVPASPGTGGNRLSGRVTMRSGVEESGVAGGKNLCKVINQCSSKLIWSGGKGAIWVK